MAKETTVRRRGGKYEAIGLILTVLGLLGMYYINFTVGGIVLAVGFVIFLVGRFM